MLPKERYTVFLPKRLSATGGTSTFARNIKQGLKRNNIAVSLRFQPKYDVLLASPTAPLHYLLHAKLRQRPIIHRLDGVYYPGSSAGWLWRILNMQLSITRKFFATTVVYQSKYSQYACNQHFQPVNKKIPKQIIYNGVDTTKFSPHSKQIKLRDNNNEHVFITASRFRTHDQIMPLLKSFQLYRKHFYKNSKLIVIGPFQERVSSIPQKYNHTPGVTFLGTIPHDKLPMYLSAADIFIMTHKTPPCPNNILEAMSSGLPICGVADGAMPELVRNGIEGELIPEPKYNRDFPAKALAKALARIMQNQPRYAHNARQQAKDNFSLSKMLNSYKLLFRSTAQSQPVKH